MPEFTMRTRIAYLASDQVTRPIGVRVVEPPADTRQAMRGNLYAVVELTSNDAERDVLAERLLSVIQRTYYSAKGSQSQVLREALRESEQSLKSWHETSRATVVEASIVVAALLGPRLMIISNGHGLALITAGRSIDVYPPSMSSGEPVPPDNSENSWKTYRQEMLTGGALFVGGRSWLRYVSLRDLAGTVAYLTPDNCAEIAQGLLTHSQQAALPGLLIALSPTTMTLPVAPPPAGLAGALRRSRVSGLPTAVNASAPVHSIPPSPSPVSQEIGAPQTTEADPTTPIAEQSAWVDPVEALARRPETSGEVIKTGLQRAREFLTGLLPERSPGATDNRLALERAARAAAVAASPPLMQGAGGQSVVGAPATGRTLPMPPLASEGSRARLFILLAVLILVLVPVILFSVQFYQGGADRERANALLDLAEARLASAQQAMDADDKRGAGALLVEAQGHIAQARNLAPGRSERADDLSVKIQLEQNELLQIQPLYGLVQPLVRFGADAQPQRIVVADQDIYILDAGRQLVQHFQIDLTNNQVVDLEGDVVLRQGDRMDNVEVGRLLDIAWQPPIPGFEDKAQLLILDRNNNLFAYDPRVEGVTRVEFGDQSAWRTPQQIESYLGRLYVVDEGANQIFRYEPGKYNEPPELWFATQTPVNLSGLQAMSIDGDIWLLFNDGSITRYQQGVQVAFELDNSVPQVAAPMDLVVDKQADSHLYLADRAQERILVFDKEGTYQRQYQAVEGHLLQGLSAIFMDEATSSMYLLTQSALYYHPLPN
jgi:hypothetical protein